MDSPFLGHNLWLFHENLKWNWSKKPISTIAKLYFHYVFGLNCQKWFGCDCLWTEQIIIRAKFLLIKALECIQTVHRWRYLFPTDLYAKCCKRLSVDVNELRPYIPSNKNGIQIDYAMNIVPDCIKFRLILEFTGVYYSVVGTCPFICCIRKDHDYYLLADPSYTLYARAFNVVTHITLYMFTFNYSRDNE